MSQGSRYEEYMTGEQFLNFAALNDSVFYLANVFKDGQMDIALAKYSPVSKELVALSTYDGLFEMVVYTVMAHPFIGLVIHYTTISCSLQSYRK